jgi:hypothetical protein
MKNKIVPLRMTAQAFLRQIRALAATSGNIFIVRHARKRMIERGFTDEDVQQVLLRGHIEEGPFRNERHSWQATIRRMRAGQEIRVVAVLEEGVIVITVY